MHESLTLCALQPLCSRSQLSRRRFYLLLFGCWLQPHIHHRCSHQRPHRWGTAAVGMTQVNVREPGLQKYMNYLCVCWGGVQWLTQNSYSFQPKAVQVILPLLLVESEEPAASSFIPLILPHRLNTILQPKHKAKSTVISRISYTTSKKQQATVNKQKEAEIHKCYVFQMLRFWQLIFHYTLPSFITSQWRFP